MRSHVFLTLTCAQLSPLISALRHQSVRLNTRSRSVDASTRTYILRDFPRSHETNSEIVSYFESDHNSFLPYPYQFIYSLIFLPLHTAQSELLTLLAISMKPSANTSVSQPITSKGDLITFIASATGMTSGYWIGTVN